MMPRLATYFTSLTFLLTAGAATADTFWQNTQDKSSAAWQSKALATQARQLDVNPIALASQFNDQRQLILELPTPEGGTLSMLLIEDSIMAPELAAKFPEIRSFKGEDINDPGNVGRFSYSPKGFHGMYKVKGKWTYFEPVTVNSQRAYINYSPRDLRGLKANWTEGQPRRAPAHLLQHASPRRARFSQATTGDTLTTYRMAISASGEYTAFHGGTTAGALAAMNTLLNRINMIFLEDLAIRLELVANNDQIIFTNANTDPFDNSDNDVDTNPGVINGAIGAANYDVGHVLNTGSGGLASNGVCNDTFKAQAFSGSSVPDGDLFYVDLVAHEIGHQFNALHSFNGTTGSCGGGNRTEDAAWEPGSGSTIMAYAGICDILNIQQNSDPFFHIGSIGEIRGDVDSGFASNCGTQSSLNNNPPTVEAGQGFIIPANTPFRLEGSGSDPDGDSLTYIWEQLDLGTASGSVAELADNGNRPLFRSFAPTSEPVRYLPQLTDVLAGRTSLGESYPNSTRALNFQLTVRDGNGGVATDSVQISSVANTGGFAVNEPTGGTRWTGNSSATVTWDVSSTDLSPISCSNVDILLSRDQGASFDTTLASSTPNDGSESIVAPNFNSSTVRIMVRCSTNIFYAVNNGSITIERVGSSVPPVITGQSDISIDEDSSREVQLSDIQVTDSDSQFPNDFTLSVIAGNNYTVSGTTVTPVANFDETLTVPITVNDGENTSERFDLSITVTPINDAPIAVNDTASVVRNTDATLINVLANDSDVDDSTLTITTFSYQGSGVAAISDNQISYQPATGFIGSETVQYTIMDAAGLTATANLTISVTETPVQNTAIPVITGQNGVSIDEDSSRTIAATDLRISDSDSTFPDDFSVTVLPGDNYSVSGAVVTPDSNFDQTLNVPVTVSDGDNESEQFILQITVNPINDVPVAVNDSLSVDQNSSATLVDVLANDSDIETTTLTLSRFDYSGNGSVSISNNQLSYQPASGFSGTESLQYTVTDAGGAEAVATLTITVNVVTTTPPPTTDSGDSGGGSLGFWSLLLLTITLVRRRKA